MGKTIEDHKADDLRRRKQELMDDPVFRAILRDMTGTSAGVTSGRVAQEVLFLLPSEFVRMYTELFDKALTWSPTGGQSGPDGVADEGRQKASGSKRGKDPMNTRSQHAAKTSGKRFVERRWAVKSEGAFEQKKKLDRSLVRGAERAIRAAAHEDSVRASLSEETSTALTGNSSTNGTARNKPGGAPQCRECGRGFAAGWVRCPFHDSPDDRQAKYSSGASDID